MARRLRRWLRLGRLAGLLALPLMRCGPLRGSLWPDFAGVMAASGLDEGLEEGLGERGGGFGSGQALGAILAVRRVQERKLRLSDAPALFDLLDRMAERSGAPAIDDLYLCDGLTAAVREGCSRGQTAFTAAGLRPTIGKLEAILPGPQDGRRQLLMGRDLLETVSISELEAIIAHELGHIAKGHHKLAAKLGRYLALSSFLGCDCGSKLSARVGKAGLAGRLFQLFQSALSSLARFYARRLLACARPLYRRAELEADDFAAAVLGREQLAAALVRTAIAEARLDNAALESCPDRQVLQQVLAEAMGPDDLHPSLQERLAALGVAPKVPPSGDARASSLLTLSAMKL